MRALATPEPSFLVAAYAAAVDRRDLDSLRDLFLPDATLTVRRGGGEPEIHRGHEGLVAVIEMLQGFEATLHEVSSLVVELDADAEARGECACVAHHITRVDGREATDLILHGRYLDRFTRDDRGAWRFATRELQVLWTEKRPVRLP